MAASENDKQPDAVSSVMKVFGILQALGEERDHGITELAQRVMMSKSTVYRFLQTMKALGYVTQEGESEKYSLTLKLFELGAKALQNVDLIRSADVQMRELSRLTKETIHLGALEEDSIVYIHKIDSLYNLRMYSRIGRRNPLHTTAIGKVLLAWRDRAEVNDILKEVEFKRSTANTIVTREALIDVLDQVKAQGFGEDNEEQEEGLRCIAVPVFDRFGVVIAGLSISFPTIRFSEEAKSDYVAMLHRAARTLSAEMGYHDYAF
ncbi:MULTISPECIES: DNA-binding transcriptional regulator KdgR [Pantoea]|jgi:IclR family KDG regulon transcriptional repressor|uniref:DNA-binding transcriptional regulator KdgR n=1 Tax=Pantoea TaxID=53335 RepID=UPI000EA1ED61|nr:MULTISPECIES: DNA-binding transcriptional regulator KdgR [Pantoea]MDU6432311.1 DNA-binding transcriptional regulator KdgR [Pantoea sp.]MBZ6387720.1 DNA-binding transcriptional regulator KdgR [Pantoea piersonii]MBZ6401516.1 DNA-binding transcriptional regulator KdgR [Pantoea piersonii]MBZ6409047.1 DNA-binding transcriptional regulator KdgR [Pantoea piersonii]MBZ6428446.1 DNA-binding transcriptional regulator KdgR [Pantoea piersonii]